MADPAREPPHNGERLWESLMANAKIGPRVAAATTARRSPMPTARGGARCSGRWCEEAGATHGLDEKGTCYARREVTDEGGLPVYGWHPSRHPAPRREVRTGCGGARGASRSSAPSRHRHQDEAPHRGRTGRTRRDPFARPCGLGACSRACHDRLGLWPTMPSARPSVANSNYRLEGRREVGPHHALFGCTIEQGPILEAEGKEGGGRHPMDWGFPGRKSRSPSRKAHTGSTPMPPCVKTRGSDGEGCNQSTRSPGRDSPDAVGRGGISYVVSQPRNVSQASRLQPVELPLAEPSEVDRGQ